MSIHKCDALLITCIDFRFVKHIKNWTNFYFEHKNYDHVSFAGSSKELDTILRQIEISVKLHDAVEVVLVHHEDCGAYGKESTERRHIAALKKAKTLPFNCLYFDDIAEFVYVARAMGIRAFQYKNYKKLKEDLSNAGILVSDISNWANSA